MSTETAVSFTVSRNVKKMKSYGEKDRTYFGRSGLYGKYAVGAYSFNNAVSATIFCHLFQQGDFANSKSVIVLMENSIHDALTSKGKQAQDKDLLDLVALIPTPQTQAIAKIGRAIDKIADFVGSSIDVATLDSFGGCNKWTATASKQYVAFALMYWAKHPSSGPAYQYYSSSNLAKPGPNSQRQPY